MFDIGWSEMLLIGGVILLVFGPKDLPKIARNLGRALNEIKRSFKNIFNDRP